MSRTVPTPDPRTSVKRPRACFQDTSRPAKRPSMQEDMAMDVPRLDTVAAAPIGSILSASPGKGKGKGRVVCLPDLPYDVWSNIFEHYYAERDHEWESTSGRQKHLFQPLLLSKELAPLSLSALYKHPHLSFRTIAPFIRSLRLPSPYLNCPKHQLVKHLTVRPSPSPSSLFAEKRASSQTAYTIHTYIPELAALLPPLQSLTLKDTLLLHQADADLLFGGLALIRPRTAHIELRMWNIYADPSAARFVELTRGPATTFSEHRPSPEDAQDLERGVLAGDSPQDWLIAMERDMELELPMGWYDNPWSAQAVHAAHGAQAAAVQAFAGPAFQPAFPSSAPLAPPAPATATLPAPPAPTPSAPPAEPTQPSVSVPPAHQVTSQAASASPPALAPTPAPVSAGDSDGLSGDDDGGDDKDDDDHRIGAFHLAPLAAGPSGASDDVAIAEDQDVRDQVWWSRPTHPPSSPLPASPSSPSPTHPTSVPLAPPAPAAPAPLPLPSYLGGSTSPDGVHHAFHPGHRSHHLAHHLRARLRALLSSSWAPGLHALCFTALDPLAALAVSDPARKLWPAVDVPIIRVHLPRGVNSLALFKGTAELSEERWRRRFPSFYTPPSTASAATRARFAQPDRIIGGTGQGEGLLHPDTIVFEVELNSVKEVLDGTWITYGGQLPPVLSRVLAGSKDWRRCHQGEPGLALACLFPRIPHEDLSESNPSRMEVQRLTGNSVVVDGNEYSYEDLSSSGKWDAVDMGRT